MTDFEKAQIKLRAWEMLKGWGATKEKGKDPEPWNWDDRLKFADLLVDWAVTPHESTE